MFRTCATMIGLTHLTLAYLLVSAEMFVRATAGHTSYPRKHSCKALTHQTRASYISAPSPPSIHGLWTSERCEIRPGPEFLVRKYRFKRGKFYLHQSYYSGPDCSDLLYGVKAQGTIKLLRPSWIVPGGMEAKYRLHNVSIIPYTKSIAAEFHRKAREQCPEIKGHTWKPYRSYQVMNFPPYKRYRRLRKQVNVDYDCTRMFNLTFHELQLIRVEIQRHSGNVNENKISTFPSQYSKRFEEVKLLLGDIHTDRNQRHTYRPTSYQAGLRNAKTKTCQVCNAIANSNDFYPPEIRLPKNPRLRLRGDWISSGCETRQYGQFLTRRLSFLPDGKSWQGEYNFFEDPLCRKGSFSLAVKGSYAGGKVSKVIPGSKEYNFRLIRLKITPKNQQMVGTLRMYDGHCGIRNKWKINEQQDVTSTGGCDVLGIILPNVEFEVIRMEVFNSQTLLYVGQRPTDNRPLKNKEFRPTSFQQPLVKCTNAVSKVISNKIETSFANSNRLPTFAKLSIVTENSGTPRCELSFLTAIVIIVNVLAVHSER